ncbi:hypothetical protein KW791_03095 [Candidatus Parcubacteria bacterium]|nr:hypothetical protein [Candidatus Parcubacteria bacterium]
MSLWSLATGSFSELIAQLIYTFFQWTGWALSWLVQLLNIAVYARVGTTIPVVTATWTILRDFSNMLFIVLLVLMAFGTIFNMNNYAFSKLITRFLITAVLINFSLAIGGLVIDASQVLSNVFLISIGDLGLKLGQYLNPSQLLFAITGQQNGVATGATLLQVTDILTTGIISLIMATILLLSFTFSVAVALIFALIRIPVLWALLIVSPVAWMANILPGTKKYFSQWWAYFFGWNLFLPIYLFFMYLGLYFLSKQSEIITAVAGTNSTNVIIPGSSSLTFNMFFFYIFATFVLLGGTTAAIKTAMAAGGRGFEGAVGFARDRVKRLPPFAQLGAAQYAAQQKLKEVQKEGLPGRFGGLYGGEAADERRKQRYAAVFGVKGFEGKAQKEFTSNAKKRFDTFEEQYDTGKLNMGDLQAKARAANAADPEGFAYIKLALKKGALKPDEFKAALIKAQKNPFAVQDLVKTAKDAKFAGIAPELKNIALDKSLESPSLKGARREMLDYIKSDAKSAGSFRDVNEISEAVDTLGGKEAPEALNFLKDMEKSRPDLIYSYRRDNQLLKEPPEDATGKKSTMPTEFGAMRAALNTEPKNIASIPQAVWGDINSPNSFQAALKDKLYDNNVSQKNRNNIRNRLEQILTEQGDDDKIAVLNKIAPRTDFGDRQSPRGQQVASNQRSTSSAPSSPPNPAGPSGPAAPTPRPPGGPSAAGTNTAGTISYRSIDVNENNIIDLRNKNQ